MVKAIVLAAGQGKRLHTADGDAPKVMRLLAGRPLLAHVLGSLDFIPAADTVLVVGYARQTVLDAFSAYPYAVQAQQRGTGHAVNAARELLAGYGGDVLVAYGDMPLVRRETYLALLELHRREANACSILSGVTDGCDSYGRILRDENGRVRDIRERRDCSPAEAAVREKNSGVYVFSAPLLFDALLRVRDENDQHEYYLTDVPKLLLADGRRVGALTLPGDAEICGVNTPEDLALCEQRLGDRQR